MKPKFITFIISTAILITACVKNVNSSNITTSFSDNSIEENSSTTISSSISNSSTSSSSSTLSINSSSKSSSTSVVSSTSSSNEFSSISSNSSMDEFDFSLEEWTSFKFYDGNGNADHNEYWDYVWGDTINPNGVLWKCPVKNAEGDGVEFSYAGKQKLVSPCFKSWKKIECRFSLWFSSKTSDKYKSTNNEPQLIIKEYSKDDKLLDKVDIELTKSDVPNNSTCYVLKTYLRNTNMSYFELCYNNSIANKDSGYTIIVHEINMKGWDYE